MASRLDICNSALIKLGAELISSLNQNNKRAKLCKNQYPKIKRKMLREHPWNFAIKRVQLTGTEITTNAQDFSHEFELPSDYLKIFRLYPDYFEYQIENRKIVANTDTLDFKYIADVDEDQFDASFEEALAYRLAVSVSYALLQDLNAKQLIIAESKEADREARSMDAQEGTPPELTNEEFLVSRRAGFTF